MGAPEHFRDQSGRVGEVFVLRCRHCGMGITHPPLPDVAFLYEGRESQDFQPTTTGVARTIKTIAFKREARQLLKQVGRTPTRVLDFGCGSGLFTRCLGDVLPHSQVVGSDFHEDAPAELEDGSYLPNSRLDGDASRYDLIMAMHVLEHDDDPVSLLRRLRSLGTADCIFVFEVPNVDCIWAGIFGHAWDAWYLPFHRLHFSRASLKSIIERSGLVVEKERDATIPSMGRSIANVLGRRNTLPFLLLGAMLNPVQWLLERISGKPSALRIIARQA
jgi:SAM-dependent methyltransferase